MAPTSRFNTPWPEVPRLLLPALWETAQMVVTVSVVVFVLGTVVGLLLFNTSRIGIAPSRRWYAPINGFVSFVRAVPFIILLIAILPLTRLLVGTGYGVPAAIVPMIVAGVPYVARLVENALRSLPPEITLSARAAGGTTLQIVRTVQISESLPSLVGVATMTVIGAIEFSAVAGAVGAGGLGNLAITYGYSRFDGTVMVAAVATLVLLIQLVQFVGDRVALAVTR